MGGEVGERRRWGWETNVVGRRGGRGDRYRRVERRMGGRGELER